MIDEQAREADRIRAYFRDASWRPTVGREWIVNERRAVVERLVRAAMPPMDQLAVCDVGCGRGADLARWHALGVPGDGLYGTELSAERAEAARRTVPGGTIAEVTGFRIPFADASFDVVTATLVLSSVLDRARRRELLREMRRVTRPGGVIAIYDFRIRKPWNPNVTAISGRELAETLGTPTSEHRLAPLLPALDLALKLPPALGEIVIAVLPRTHRLWTWTRRT